MACFAYQVISEIKEVSLQQQKGLRLLNLSSSNPNANTVIHTCNRILTVGLKKKKLAHFQAPYGQVKLHWEDEN